MTCDLCDKFHFWGQKNVFFFIPKHVTSLDSSSLCLKLSVSSNGKEGKSSPSCQISRISRKSGNSMNGFCWLLYLSGDFSRTQGSFADEDRDQGAPTRGVQLNEIDSPSSS